MKTNYKKIAVGIFGVALLLSSESFRNPAIQQPGARWKAPASADSLNNPFAYSAATAAEQGQKLYTQYCASCHGNSCKGDGIAAASLTPRPANFLDPSIVKETDGALYWKITNGKSPMPTWGNVLSTFQRWDIVCFIRSMQAKAPAGKGSTAKKVASTR